MYIERCNNKIFYIIVQIGGILICFLQLETPQKIKIQHFILKNISSSAYFNTKIILSLYLEIYLIIYLRILLEVLHKKYFFKALAGMCYFW